MPDPGPVESALASVGAQSWAAFSAGVLGFLTFVRAHMLTKDAAEKAEKADARRLAAAKAHDDADERTHAALRADMGRIVERLERIELARSADREDNARLLTACDQRERAIAEIRSEVRELRGTLGQAATAVVEVRTELAGIVRLLDRDAGARPPRGT